MKCAICGTDHLNPRFCSKRCAAANMRAQRQTPGARFLERFWQYVDVRGPEECWPWTGATDRKGYGKFGVVAPDGRNLYLIASRLAWELANGAEIAEGIAACHRCDNPPCCNPAHVFLGTQLDNVRDAKAKDRAAVGERHGMAKLTAEDVREIRSRDRRFGDISRWAREFGVSREQMDNIVKFKQWIDIPVEIS